MQGLVDPIRRANITLDFRAQSWPNPALPCRTVCAPMAQTSCCTTSTRGMRPGLEQVRIVANSVNTVGPRKGRNDHQSFCAESPYDTEATVLFKLASGI